MSDVREADPWTLSYLVTVEAARQAEQLRVPSLECAPLGPAAPAAAATEYTEPEVVFRLRGTASSYQRSNLFISEHSESRHWLFFRVKY